MGSIPSFNDIKQEGISDAIPDLVSVRLLELLNPEQVEVLHRVRITGTVRDDHAVTLAFRQERSVFDGRQSPKDVLLKLLTEVVIASFEATLLLDF